MYRGTAPIESAKRFLGLCQEKQIPYLFMTNNSMRTPQMNTDHMLQMGYTGIRSDQFYNSAMASCEYAKTHYSGNKAYYVGKEGMREALLDTGFELSDEHPDLVFIGLDKEATYDTYSKALKHLLDGAVLIGTNSDRILASPDGFEMGNGSIVAMFEYALHQKSPMIAKPNRPILDLCLQHFGLDKEDIILIGDNLETDIRLGVECAVPTVFVETGIHTRKDIERLGIYPDVVISHLMELSNLEFLK